VGMKVGVIAEDDSDVDVLKILAQKISGTQNFKVKKFVGNGCGKLKSKCLLWAKNLKLQGCKMVVLMHDLDNKDIDKLKGELKKAFSPCPIKDSLIVIPIQEIEAWLLSDEDAIYAALNLKHKVRKIPNPESIFDPKKKLGEIIHLKSGKTKRYLNTKHNKKIALCLNLDRIRKCNSYVPLENFIKEKLK
jgi:uncharacterized protein DUF4276